MADITKTISERTAVIVRAPRTRKIAIWCVSIIAAIGILGALIAPYVLRRVLSDQLTTKLHRQVTIEQIRINPYAMTVAVRGFLMKERGGNATAVAFDELHLNVQLLSLFRWGLVVKELRLIKPYINLVRQEDFKYNYQDIIDEFTAGPSGPTPRFALNNIQIIDGKIDFDDRPEQTKHSITSVRLGVPFISSLPSYTDIFVKPALSAVINGTPLDLKGETKPFKDSLESDVQLNIDDLQIPKYLAYSPVKLNFTVPSGRIDGKLTASFKTAKGQDAVLAIAGDIALRDLVMKEKGDVPLLNLPALDITLDALRVFANSAVVKTVKAEGLELHLQRQRDGGFNFANLIEAPPKPAQADPEPQPAANKDGAPFIYQVDDLLLESGKLVFDDKSTPKPYQSELENIRVNVKSLTNKPGGKSSINVSFDSKAKEHVDYSASLQLAPLTVIDGKFDIKQFRLDSLFPYYDDVLNLEIRRGLLDLAGSHILEEGDKEWKILLSDINATFRSLQLHLPGKPEPLWRIPTLAIRDTNLDVSKRAIAIGDLSSQGGRGAVEREADGSINYARLFKAQPQAESPKTAATETPWQVTARNVDLNRFAVAFDDNSLATPAKIVITDLSWRAQNFSNARDSRSKLTIQAKVNDGGVVRLTGPAGANPIGGKLAIEADQLALVPFQPYFTDQINFLLTGGQAGAKGTLTVDANEQGSMNVTYQGDLKISDFATVEKDGAQDLLKWQLLSLNGVNYSLEPMRTRIDEVNLTDFYSRVIIAADGKINLQNLTVDKTPKPEQSAEKKPAAQVEPKASSAAPETEKPISIGKINLLRGNINFSDFFVKPNYTANLTGVQGTIAELKPEAPGDIALEAKLDNAAPVDIRGKINPLGKELFMDIKAKASEIELSAFSPYSGKYVGYGIEKGQLTFDVAYKLENRKLDAQTQFILNQLTFGDKIDSPTAMNLPVTLAVALLKDRNGVIDVGLPISGSLDDPQFSIGGIVWRIIVNIITKAVTAPFALLGAAFGGGGAELSYIEFDYGRATLSQTAETKIKTLATAMTNRPGLKLEIIGRSDPVGDLDGLRRVSIENKVRAQKFKELARQGTAPKSVEDVQVNKDEYERFLRAAYDEESFPKPRNVIGLAKSLPVPEMENLMLKYAKVSDDEARELANRRAQVVRERLLAAQIAADRLFTVAAKPLTTEEQEKIKARPSRVDFSLR
jgi:uncharacterized protein involved in outer membrane biogenesis